MYNFQRYLVLFLCLEVLQANHNYSGCTILTKFELVGQIYSIYNSKSVSVDLEDKSSQCAEEMLPYDLCHLSFYELEKYLVCLSCPCLFPGRHRVPSPPSVCLA